MSEIRSQETPTEIVAADVSRRRAARVLLLILALGLSLRVYHALRAVIISPDSAVFIAYARQLGEAPLAAAREYAGRQHPLYPALILLVHEPIGWFAGENAAGWILAGRVVAIMGGLAAILAMYWLSVRLMDRRRALIAAAMLAVLPDACRVGADVLSDLPHLAFYLVGLAALLAGIQTGRSRFVVLCAAASGLAFLTRPEGAAVLAVGLAIVLFHGAWRFRRRLGLALAMIGVFAAVAAPYQLATGKLIPKKSLPDLLKFGEADNRFPGAAGQREECFLSASTSRRRVSTSPLRGGTRGCAPPPLRGESRWTGGVEGAAVQATNLPVPINILRQWVRAGRVVYILLAIVGLIVARPRGVGGRLLGFAIGLHVTLLYVLEMRYGYLDRRHALILATLSLPLAAEGVWWLATRISDRGKTFSETTRTRAVLGILAACVLATGYWLALPINGEERHVAAAARWVADNTRSGDEIVTDDRLHRVALCADRTFVRWPWWDGKVRDLARFLADKSACYFVVDRGHITQPKRNPDFFRDLEAGLGDRLKLVDAERSAPGAPDAEIRIYRYTAPDSH